VDRKRSFNHSEGEMSSRFSDKLDRKKKYMIKEERHDNLDALNWLAYQFDISLMNLLYHLMDGCTVINDSEKNSHPN